MAQPFVGPQEPASHYSLPRQARGEDDRKKTAQLNKALLAGPIAANLYDAVATKQALKKGGREANPILAPFVDNDPLFYASKIASGVLSSLAANALAKKGHRNWAKAVAGISIGVPLGAGTHNLVQAAALERERKR